MPARPRTDPGAGRAPGSGLLIGDAVELDLPVARVASRGVARLIDLAVQAVLLIVLQVALSAVLVFISWLDTALMDAVLVIVVVAVFLAYPIVLETLTRGRTVGKLVMGLRVVRDDGGAIRFRQALTRELVGYAAEWPGLMPPLTWVASLACMLSDTRGRRVGDISAGTIVVHERTPIVWGWIPVMPPHLAGWAATLDLGAVSDDLALQIRQYLIRYRFLTPASRTCLGIDLTTELAALIQPPPPPGAGGRDFLIAVLAERHRRSLARLVRSRTATAAVWPELMRATGYDAWVAAAVPAAGPPRPLAAPVVMPAGPPPLRTSPIRQGAPPAG